ncbi:hypothetical protein FQA39_LY06727 [Lamprigera yunnana]|nr:hypothetical protein FQA39_LY06727 [Lamprigera yunnana]
MFFKFAAIICAVVACYGQRDDYRHSTLYFLSILFESLGSVGDGGVVYYSAPVIAHSATQIEDLGHVPGQHIEEHAHNKYEFNYGVYDAHTNNYHNQYKVRDGDAVHKVHLLTEVEGIIRNVKYTDHLTRFGLAVHPRAHGHTTIAVNDHHDSRY